MGATIMIVTGRYESIRCHGLTEPSQGFPARLPSVIGHGISSRAERALDKAESSTVGHVVDQQETGVDS